MDFYQMRFYAFAYLEYIIPTLIVLWTLYTIILTKWLKQPKKGLYGDVISAALYTLQNTEMLTGRWSTFIVFNWITANTKKYIPILDDRMKIVIFESIQTRKELEYYYRKSVLTKNIAALETLHKLLEILSEKVGRDFKKEFKIARESNALMRGNY